MIRCHKKLCHAYTFKISSPNLHMKMSRVESNSYELDLLGIDLAQNSVQV
jgi:hypothetical protein